MQQPTDWNFSLLIDDFSETTVEKDKQAILERTNAFIKKWKESSEYLEKPDVLRVALDEVAELQAAGGTGGNAGYAIGLYATLDQTNADRRALENTFDNFARRLSTDMQFFFIRLGKVSQEQQQKFLAAPELLPYKHFLQGAFEEGIHTLSEPEERIETLKANVSVHNWVNMVEGLISEESRLVNDNLMTLEELLTTLRNPDKATRDQAAAGINDVMEKYKKVAENEMNSVLEYKKIEDELRGWEYPESSRLFSDDVTKEVVDVMTEVVAEANVVANEYYALKAKALGLPKLAYHERNLAVGDSAQQFSYEKGYEIVYKVMQSLDPEFADILQGFSEGGQIDVYPHAGKRGGAACWHNAISQPTYILLNWTNTTNDVLTLAHEVGHGINNELIKKKQHALDFGTPTSTAEVASTFMEDFVLEEIKSNSSDAEKKALLFQKLDDIVSTIFRQVACYRFEQELHATFRAKGYVSSDEIGQIFQKHMAAYMGPAVEQSSGSENWWIYWSHIRAYFYVYSYASGLLISMALQRKTRENPAFIADVKEFLSAGLSDSPEHIFQKLGIDITSKEFWESGIAEIRTLLEELKQTV